MEMEQQDLPPSSLGAFGIFKESFKLIFKWHKIFMKIALAFIFPLSFLSLAYYGISMFISGKMIDNNNNTPILDHTKTIINSLTYPNVSDAISSEWTVYWLLINIVYLAFSLIFSLFSISAIVYTVACFYTDKEPTFKKAISVIPKVWKRVLITSLCKSCIIFVYTFVIVFVTLILAVGITIACNSYGLQGGQVGVAILVIIYAILFLIGLFHLSIIWQLANVVSVMEKICGMQAMTKSKTLTKGKMGASIGVFFLLGLWSLPNFFLVKQLEGLDWKSICWGILYLVFMTFVYLLNIVVQTVLYFVCKSYHHEIIDESYLAYHFEADLGKVNDSQQEPLLNV